MENPWKVIAAFLGVFVAGVIFGGFFSIGVGARWLATRPDAANVSPSAPAVLTTKATSSSASGGSNSPRTLLPVPVGWQAPQLMRHYADRLELTTEQKEHITPLIRRAIEDYRRVQQTTFRETGIILQRLQEDIAKELTPEQRRKLEDMKERQLERQREVFQKLERQRELRKAGQREKNAPEATGAGQAGATTPSASSSGAESTATPSKTGN